MFFWKFSASSAPDLGESDDAEHAEQDRHDDHHGSRRQILFHGNLRLLTMRLLAYFFASP